MSAAERAGGLTIWLYAAGYFTAYAPYAALTKAITSGTMLSQSRSGVAILPLSTLASLVGMTIFIFGTDYWRFATRHRVLGLSLPGPTRFTLTSGLATAAVIGTTTLSYTIQGTSILVMMLFMRGGVLVIAPVVDLLSGRRVRWQAWAALGLSLTALAIGVGDGKFAVGAQGVIVIALYLAAYFVRLRLMSSKAKSDDPNESKRFFVEEQLVATPAIVASLALVAALGSGDGAQQLASGFRDIFSGGWVSWLIVAIGVLSQGTGVFGALVLLDGRENAFCVPVNRASSVLAGVVASFGLWLFAGTAPVPARELIGASLLVAAIVLLALSGKPAPTPAKRPA